MSGVDTACIDCGMPYQSAAEAADCRFCLEQERDFWPERFDQDGIRIS